MIYKVLKIFSLVRISRFSHFIPGDFKGFLSEFLTKMRLQLNLKQYQNLDLMPHLDVCMVYDNNNSSIPETDKVQYLCVFPIKKRLTINGHQFCDQIFAQNKQILKNLVVGSECIPNRIYSIL